MKQAIFSHFSGNFEPFYRKYLSNIENIGGAEWRAMCPFHQDKDPSFNFCATTGRFFCHGCGKKGDIFHFYGKSNGLATGPDFGRILEGIGADFGISKPGPPGPPMPAAPRSKIVAVYDYCDADGKPLFQCCRIEPGRNGKAKDFFQRQRGADGKWINSLKGLEPVLYRLPEVIQAKEVLIVEGEKDADNVRELGFTATTCPMGAGKWRDSYSQALKNKAVVLIPDNDAPGMEHMVKVAQAVNGTAATIKLLTVDGLPEKSDISDFIVRFENKSQAAERLAVMVDGCPEYKPPDRAIDKPGGDGPKKPSMGSILNFTVKREYTEMLEKQVFYYDNLVAANQISTVIAMPGGGKTTIFYDFVSEKMIRDHGVTVFYMDCDSPANDHKRMFEASERYGPNFKWINPVTHGGGAIDLLKGLNKMAAANERLNKHVFIMDTLKKFTDVLDKRQTKPFFNLTRRLLSLGATIVLLGHANKYRNEAGNLVYQGTVDIQSDVDALIYFERLGTIGGIDVTTVIDPEKGAKVRGLYAPISFHIDLPSREVSQYGKAIDPPDYNPPSGKIKKGPNEEEVAKKIRSYLVERGHRIKQVDLIETISSQTGVGMHRVRKILNAIAIHEHKALRGQVYYSIGPHNKRTYQICD